MDSTVGDGNPFSPDTPIIRMAKLQVFELRKEIVIGLVWDREFDRGVFYHHHSSNCMQNI